MGRHRHAVTVRADGLGPVLGPLLNDPRVVLAALVDVDSGMVLDACTPERSGARSWGADLEMTGAGHAELARVALALPGRAGPTPAGDELVVSAGPGRHHLVLALPDPHGGRLVLSVVVDGSRRLALRVLRRLRAVPAETLTAGPTVVRRPGVGGWVAPLEPAPPADGRVASRPGGPDPAWPGGHPAAPGGGDHPGYAAEPGATGDFYPQADPQADHRTERWVDHGPDTGTDHGAGYRQFGPPHRAGPHSAEPERVQPGHRLGRPDQRAGVGAVPVDGWSERAFAVDPFPLRTETAAPRPAAVGLFDPSVSPARAGPARGPSRWTRPVPPVTPGPSGAPGGAPIGLVDPPVDRPPVTRGEVPAAEVVRPPAPPSALPPRRPG